MGSDPHYSLLNRLAERAVTVHPNNEHLKRESTRSISSLVKSSLTPNQGFFDKPIPHFDIERFMCARYARLSAKSTTGVVYVPAPAWNFADANVLVSTISGYKELYDAFMKGKLKFGESIVTFFNPVSSKNRVDRLVTHAALFWSVDDKGILDFVHQYDSDQVRENVVKFHSRGLIPRQITSYKD